MSRGLDDRRPSRDSCAGGRGSAEVECPRQAHERGRHSCLLRDRSGICGAQTEQPGSGATAADLIGPVKPRGPVSTTVDPPDAQSGQRPSQLDVEPGCPLIGHPVRSATPTPDSRREHVSHKTPGQLLDPQAGDGPRDDQLLDLFCAFEDVVGMAEPSGRSLQIP